MHQMHYRKVMATLVMATTAAFILIFIGSINTTALGSQDNSSSYSLISKWGSKGTGDGQLMYPHSIAVDSLGNVYVTDTGNKRVQKFDSNGKFITKWGFEGTGGRQSSRAPHSIAVDPLGNVYLADKNGGDILKFDSNGKFITKWGSEGTSDGQFKKPEDIAVDPSGNVYVSDTRNSRIQVFDVVRG